jgi:hypothetical protein
MPVSLTRPVAQSVVRVLSIALVTTWVLQGVLAGNWERTVIRSASRGAITLHAANRGRPFLNLQDGREMNVAYRGEPGALAALQNGAVPRSLASADFDQNGTPDVVAGFASGSGGTITLQRGNPDAFAPADD